ncbi:group III truncated hemoglobin [Pseudoxanthomonas sp. SE1]|uniref:group III truncated hemoglobin n=1 Tax=Pseudoxanthomonas sp. SE1 TaxID=1664560 RepID=UPI00240E14BD|nr:group III truncated hemoglobin [Pseudoxanthomonas sp. SE1]WFC40274.1 group III truncated hemoglobin [Pseudoxanthomonas sp. SE1]WFC43723.1 group III truncated hemoglobin [Pseudoxanthomonas sp. SE1]
MSGLMPGQLEFVDGRSTHPHALERQLETIAMNSRELNSPEAIADCVDAFYAKVIIDAALGPIFKEVDLQQHKPTIRAYWRKMLLGEHEGYRRNMIAQHIALHTRHSLQHHHFQRWLELFVETVDEQFCGHAAVRAKRLATTIAINLEALLDVRRM